MKKLMETLRLMGRLPVVTIGLPVATEAQRALYNSFVKPHPRLRVIRNKTWGVELITLCDFDGFDAYVQSVSGKNSAAYFARRCAKMGYTFNEFNPRERNEEIMAIHRSAESRQGRSIDVNYFSESLVYPIDTENSYFGVFEGNALVAYVWIQRSGPLALFNRIMGHSEHLKNNVMYLLCMQTMERLLGEPKLGYAMYDMFFGATEGLRLFKKRIGFKPYRVKWVSL